jgi:hypothetical protein
MRRFLPVLFLVAFPSLVHAQSFQLQYAAKFVCGKADTTAGNFAPGTYFTTINVYNTSSPAIDKRIVIALPDEKAGGSTKPIAVTLPNGRAMQIDCKNILGHLKAEGIPTPALPVDGFVIIRAFTPIDVVGIYTTVASTGIATMEMERVPERKLP